MSCRRDICNSLFIYSYQTTLVNHRIISFPSFLHLHMNPNVFLWEIKLIFPLYLSSCFLKKPVILKSVSSLSLSHIDEVIAVWLPLTKHASLGPEKPIPYVLRALYRHAHVEQCLSSCQTSPFLVHSYPSPVSCVHHEVMKEKRTLFSSSRGLSQVTLEKFLLYQVHGYEKTIP